MDSSTRAGLLRLLAAVTLFSTLEVTAKLLGPDLPPLRQAFLRFAIAGLILALPAARAARRAGRRATRHDAILLVGMGAVGVAGGIGLFHLAIAWLPANQAAILFSGNPVFVAWLAPLLLKEPRPPRMRLALALCLTGIAILLRGGGAWSWSAATGAMLMVLSMLGFALYSVMARRCRNVFDPLTLTAGTALTGAVCLLPLTATLEGPPFAALPPGAAGLLAYMAIGGTALAYWAWFSGLRRVEAARGALLFFLKPVLAPLLAWLALDEPLTPALLAGAALIVSGTAIAVFIRPGR